MESANFPAHDREGHGDVSPGTREREFYRFYQPRNYGLEFVPLKSNPRPSPDKALTAFCQLASHRLNCRRSQISFFDRKRQYILAESTRTSSLQDGSTTNSEDALWGGITCLDRQESICSKAVEMSLMFDHDKDVTVYIIPDMSIDERVKNRDIVKNGRARFYAGVPIRSPFGHSIGAYCVIDDTPRPNGLSKQDIAFMKADPSIDMATVIMVHMERTRATEASIRSERMLRGLGSFVDGNFSVSDWWMQPKSKDETQGESLQEYEHWSHEQFAAQYYRSKTPSGPSSRAASRRQSDTPPTKDQPEVPTTSEGKVSRSSSEADVQPISKDVMDTKRTSNKQQEVVTNDIKSTFSRASHIIRDVTSTDEAIFFDASIGSFGGLVVTKPDRRTKDVNDSLEDSSDDEDNESEEKGDYEGSNMSRHEKQRQEALAKPCEVLGFAGMDYCSLDGHVPADNTRVMTEGFLRSLLYRYPSGKILTFDEEPRAHEGKVDQSPSQKSGGDTSKSKSKSVPKFSRRHEASLLRKIFIGVRSLAIVPLFDATKEKWFAGGIVWTKDPMRILSSELELSYLAAFGNSIMAEVHRLEAKKADTAKTKFIGSVSHELRSPLHGILGSIECLQDTELDNFQENMAHTVETCGKTLLDTIDHLLDFAKINNFVHKPREQTVSGKANQSQNEGDQKKQFALEVDVDLSVITEEVLETVFAGYDFSNLNSPDQSQNQDQSQGPSSSVVVQQLEGKIRQSPANTKGPSRPIAIIVDIDKAEDSHWIFRTQAGAWRRVIMNLFGNALKYTDEGFIQVKLSAEPLPTKNKPGKSRVTLTVTDSGRGMSADYLDTQLFQPFAQENSLTPGTGLGLSIVKQIVESMGGEIDVQSEKNHGTQIMVSMALVHAPKSLESLEQSLIASTARKTDGLKIGFVGFEADTFRPAPNVSFRDPINARHHFMQSFHTLCKSWFGMEMQIEAGLDFKDADIYLTTEHGADEIQDQLARKLKSSGEKERQGRLAATPLLVICDAASTAQRKLQSKNGQKDNKTAEFISQPCGPRKLAKSLVLCLERSSSKADPDKPYPTPAQAFAEESQDTDYKSDIRTHQANESGTQQTFGGHEPEQGDGALAKSGEPPVKHPKDDVLDIDQGDGMTSAEKGLPIRSNESKMDAQTKQADPRTRTEREAGNQQSSSSASTASPKEVQNVLLVDDNHINLQLLVTYMKKNKHNYVSATNGLEAFEAYKKATKQCEDGKNQNSDDSSPAPRHFDYVLMDLSMPVMDGLESTRQIRAHEREKDLNPSTVIALTGLASASAQQEAYSSGVDIFLTKPVSLKELKRIFETKGQEGGSARKDSTGDGGR